MNTDWLISILFLFWWVTAPISELFRRRLEKAKCGCSEEEILNTGVTVVGIWIISAGFFAIARCVDVSVSPWGTNTVAFLTSFYFVFAWVTILIDIFDLKKCRRAISTKGLSEEYPHV